MSARIGDAKDAYENGVVSGVNKLSKALGIQLHMTVKESVNLLN